MGRIMSLGDSPRHTLLLSPATHNPVVLGPSPTRPTTKPRAELTVFIFDGCPYNPVRVRWIPRTSARSRGINLRKLGSQKVSGVIVPGRRSAQSRERCRFTEPSAC